MWYTYSFKVNHGSENKINKCSHIYLKNEIVIIYTNDIVVDILAKIPTPLYFSIYRYSITYVLNGAIYVYILFAHQYSILTKTLTKPNHNPNQNLTKT